MTAQTAQNKSYSGGENLNPQLIKCSQLVFPIRITILLKLRAQSEFLFLPHFPQKKTECAVFAETVFWIPRALSLAVSHDVSLSLCFVFENLSVSVRCEILQHSANLILRPMCAASLCLQEIKCLQPKVNVFTKRLHVGVKSKHFGSNREWWQIYDMLEGNCWNFVQYINGVSQFKSVIFIHEIETVA